MTSLLGVSGGAMAPAANAASNTPVRGGTLTVLENTGGIGNWPQGLDPAQNVCCLVEDEPFNDAIFGQLFTQNSKGQAVPDLATGYKFSDGNRVVAIYLRKGVKFTDGTPFNAAAVKFNILRDLQPAHGRMNLFTSFPVQSVTTPNSTTVVLHMTEPFSSIINSFDSVATPNWIASPTALKKEGPKEFTLKPVGAGPFEVASDTLNSKLVLKANPNYWQKGHPYLNEVIFESVGTDESGYSALQSGEAQVFQQVLTQSVVDQAKKNPQVQVSATPGAGTLGLQLNTTIPPFNNITARLAVYHALNPEALNKVLSDGDGTVSETGDGPASLFPILKVPGYPTYNLAKARAEVKQLGGLSFNITGGTSAPQASIAEQSEFAAAGMKTKIVNVNLAQLVAAFEHNTWQITGGGAGGLDPAIGVGGMAWRALSTAPFTGIKDPTLDKMIQAGEATTDQEKRLAIYKQLFTYMAKKAYLPFLYAGPLYNISDKTVHGPGLSSVLYNNYLIEWPDIWLSK